MDKRTFSDAPWLNRTRITNYSRMLAGVYALLVIVWVGLSPNLVDPNGKVIGTDFMGVWTAGKMAQENKAAATYDYETFFAVQQTHIDTAAQQKTADNEVPFYPWHYPPLFLMVAALLALLPYGAALAVWMALTLAAYVKTVRAILPRAEVLAVALAFPAVFVNIGHGQSGFLITALMGSGLLLLQSRPVLAGVLFGLMACKPQFGILVPVALLAGKYWRSFFAAGLTIVLICAFSGFVFGWDVWQAFLESLPNTRERVLELGGPGWAKMQSTFAAVRMLGGSVGLAYVIQFMVAVPALLAVVFIWRRNADFALKASVLALATVMVTPYVFDYDLTLLALPIAWMALVGLRDGFLPWEKLLLLLAWLLPICARIVGTITGIPLTPVVLLLLLGVLWRRAGLNTQT